jgi:hypothetical protein
LPKEEKITFRHNETSCKIIIQLVGEKMVAGDSKGFGKTDGDDDDGNQ